MGDNTTHRPLVRTETLKSGGDDHPSSSVSPSKRKRRSRASKSNFNIVFFFLNCFYFNNSDKLG